MTAATNLVLGIFAVGLMAGLVGASYETTKASLASPVVAILLLLFVLSASYHMKLGMQVIIEDYVQSKGSRILLRLLNVFYSVFVGVTCVFAILKLSFGA